MVQNPTSDAGGPRHDHGNPRASARLPRHVTLMFAIGAGVAVGNLYLAQPLLDFIAANLHTSTSAAGWLVTATQLGYVVGIVLILPLGDIVDRRRLVPGTLVAAAVALVACALAPTFAVLVAALTAVGISTVAGQLLVPLAGDLADAEDRGRAVGTVVSGVLTGILVSRTISGLVASATGWRTVFAAAAVLDVVVALVLYRAIPRLPARATLPYRALIASVAAVVRRERALRWTLALGSAGFGLFTMFWTALTFLLSDPPFSYSVGIIGLFGLAGLSGALAAQRAGRLHDRGWSLPATGLGWVVVLVCFVVAALARHSVVLLLIDIVVLDVAIQGLNILNQTRALSIDHDARSRLNTAFVTGNFIGGAIGSAAAAVLWHLGGWPAVCAGGVVGSVYALLVWAVGRRSALVVSTA